MSTITESLTILAIIILAIIAGYYSIIINSILKYEKNTLEMEKKHVFNSKLYSLRLLQIVKRPSISEEDCIYQNDPFQYILPQEIQRLRANQRTTLKILQKYRNKLIQLINKSNRNFKKDNKFKYFGPSHNCG